MITHLSLIGHAGEIVAEVRQAPIGAADDEHDVIALALGASFVVHLDMDAAESIAEALIDAITTRDDAVTINGPVPFVPTWEGLA